MIELIESTEIVRPFNTWTRFSSGALGSKPAASAKSFRIEVSTKRWSCIATIARSFWPCAAARVTVGGEAMPTSALPPMTALAEPTPAMSVLLTLSPCFSQRCRSSAR